MCYQWWILKGKGRVWIAIWKIIGCQLQYLVAGLKKKNAIRIAKKTVVGFTF